MKSARLVCTAFAVALITGWATYSFACDQHKNKTSAANTVYQASATGKATTASAPHACSAEMAAKCTPEMAAACKAHKMSATTAAATPSTKTTVVLASSSGGDACCASKGNKASKASAASMANAKSASSCGAKGSTTSATKFDASAAGSSCGMGAMAANNPHDDCEACIDMSSCSEALDAVGAHRQAVRLKNGVMYVYTADSQRNVGAVQAAVARRGQRMTVLTSAGEKARLCAECKSMRGAMASGKLTREVVNIEGGSLTLITSTDPALVAKIHAMSDTKLATRTKS